MLTDEARVFLKKNHIDNYVVNSDGMINTSGDIVLFVDQNKLPVKFGRVDGYFYCDKSQLTSLEGAPSHVNGNFYCSYNQLTSLHNVHKHIKEINGWFYCRHNDIKDSVLGLLLIKEIKGITLDNREIENILNKYLCHGRAGVIGAQQELFDAGLDEYARL